jgi:hypothetical protein
MPTQWKECSRGHRFQKSSDCPVCPECWPGYYEKNKDKFPGLSGPALRALLNENITTRKKLSKHSEKEILELHGMGPKSLPTLRALLKEEGLEFRKS